ncbi:MAG: prepilin peptidase [Gemmatimonadota bacterium]|nr:prepilin peptidase [Gemmatimonadota bacterium]
MTHLYATVALFALVAGSIVWDVRERRVPDAFTVGGVAVALGLRALGGWGPLLDGVAAAGVGLLIALPLVLAGGLGGGDAKLLAAVGAFLGLAALPVALTVTALAGGVMAVGLATARGRLRETLVHCGRLLRRTVPFGHAPPARTLATPGALAIPYGVAIGLGALAGWWA